MSFEETYLGSEIEHEIVTSQAVGGDEGSDRMLVEEWTDDS